MGNSYANKGEYDKAIEAYQQAIKLNPKSESAYNNMGLSYSIKGEYDKAIEAFQQAIKLNPKDDSAYCYMGLSYGGKGKYDKAIETLQEAIKLNPKHDSAYYYMGLSYDNKGEYDKAIEAFQQAIKLNPKYDSAYHNMGYSYIGKSDYDRAIEAFKKAIEIDSQDNYIYPYSFLLLFNNQYNDAITELKKVLNFHNYLKFSESMIEYFLLLIAKRQTQSLYSLFEQYPKLKNEFKPVYYTLMYFMQEEYPTEYKRMGSELEETVEEMIAEVKDIADKYGV